MIALEMAIGLVVGLALGALGGGGSVLTVPALVYVLGESPHSAATASLIIVGASALAGLHPHHRSRNVRWAAGAAFGVVGIAASVLGTVWSRHVDPNLLLLCFAALIVVAAGVMLRQAGMPARWRRPRPEPGTDRTFPDTTLGGGAPSNHTAAVVAPERAEADTPARSRTTVVVRVLLAGSAVGLMTGLFGVGGGFLVVPALVLVLGWEMPVAVGTSLLIVALNSASSLSVRLATEPLHWSVIVPVAVAAIIATILGKRFADRFSSASLSRAFAVLLLAVAAYTAIQSVVALNA